MASKLRDYVSWCWSSKLVVLVLVLLRVMFVRMSSTNVALNKPTSQRDVNFSGVSSRAVDGNTNTDFFGGNSCTHTRSTTSTWWMVDLVYSYGISSFHIYNRKSSEGRLRDFYIYASTVKPTTAQLNSGQFIGEMCVHHLATVGNGGPHVVKCTKTVHGRYVYVWKPGNRELTLCEFKVLFDGVKQARYKLHVGKKSLQTPSFRKILSKPSLRNCLLMCIGSSAKEAIHVQLDKTSGSCECVWYTSSENLNDNMAGNPNFDLYVIN